MPVSLKGYVVGLENSLTVALDSIPNWLRDLNPQTILIFHFPLEKKANRSGTGWG